MRYLPLLLLGPWLVILAWAYWAVGKRFRRTWQLKLYDITVILIALGVAYGGALVAFDDIAIQNVGSFGRESGGIWKQVMPALYGYGAFAAVMAVGMAVRWFLGRRESTRER
ncbi:hypothetical protein [Dyella choica]|uniref:Uncharacterized protein n=1 Tax=Dyella choica TaxID=1927959 RepID=A0A3S0PMD4_9GAMM|nr:hypothetical protein [Dyella choica]RUL75931.1 hypothetical protein EKH80_09395 [Dyella choica]